MGNHEGLTNRVCFGHVWYDHLTRRYRSACFWLESNFNSLAYWRRFVEGVEHIIAQFRREEVDLTPFEGSAFMRELCTEDPRLWAAHIAMATPATEPVTNGEGDTHDAD